MHLGRTDMPYMSPSDRSHPFPKVVHLTCRLARSQHIHQAAAPSKSFGGSLRLHLASIVPDSHVCTGTLQPSYPSLAPSFEAM